MHLLKRKELSHWVWGTRYLCACHLDENASLKYDGFLKRFSQNLTHIPFFLIHDLFDILEHSGGLKLREMPSCSKELTDGLLKYRAVLGKLSADAHFIRALLLVETAQNKSETLEWLFLEILNQWSVLWPKRFSCALSELKIIESRSQKSIGSKADLNHLLNMFPTFTKDLELLNQAAMKHSFVGKHQITILEQWPLIKNPSDQYFLQQLIACYEDLGPISTVSLEPNDEEQEIESIFNTENNTSSGGIEGLSKKGPEENLLPTEIAYMEDEDNGEIDLFDWRYVEHLQLYFVRDDAVLLRKKRHIIVLIDVGETFFFQSQSSRFTYGVQMLSCLWRMMDCLLHVCSKDMIFTSFVICCEDEESPFLNEIKIFLLQIQRLLPKDRLRFNTLKPIDFSLSLIIVHLTFK